MSVVRATWRAKVLGSMAIALIFAAGALASATPRTGDWSGIAASNDRGAGIWHVAHSEMTRSRDAKGIIVPGTYKCNAWNLRPVASKIAISNGKFKYVGNAYLDSFHNPKLLGTLTWTGTYTRTRVTGTVRLVAAYTSSGEGGELVRKHCDTGALRWTGFVAGTR